MPAGSQVDNSFSSDLNKKLIPLFSKNQKTKPMPRSNKKKGAILNLALVFSSIATGIGACLILDFTTAKIKEFTKHTSSKKPIVDTQNSGWYRLKPNQDRHVYFGKFKYRLLTDNNGFRVGPTSTKRDKYDNSRTPTLFLLGDSFTYGSGLNWEKTFAGILENNYNVNIINAGTESYSPTPYTYILEKSLQKSLLPDNSAVVMAVDISDVQDESTRWTKTDDFEPPSLLPKIKHSESTASKEANPATSNPPSTLSQKLASFASNNLPSTLRLIRIARHGPEAMKSDASPHNAPDEQILYLNRSAFTHTNWDSIEEHYQPLGIKKGLQKIKDQIKISSELAKKNGLKFYLLAYPWPAQVYINHHFDWVDFLKTTCLESGCNGVINTFPHFSPKSPKEDYFFTGDMHFNKKGNKFTNN